MIWLSTRAVFSVISEPRKYCPSNDAATKGFRNAYIAKYVVNAAPIAKATNTGAGARSRRCVSLEARRGEWAAMPGGESREATAERQDVTRPLRPKTKLIAGA